MERMTLREAAERSSRSITTLRRYIRSGRLHAEKRYGRYGPEYFVSLQDLADAGLEPDAGSRATTLPARSSSATALSTAISSSELQRPAHESVPLSLYQDLQMKHEQLLVQYGMVRAGGLRVMELQAELESRQRKLEQAQSVVSRLRKKLEHGTSALNAQLEQSQQELEGRNLEISALQEKVRALEMMTRNAVTNETIDKQFRQIMEQTRRVERMKSRTKWSAEQRSSWQPPQRDEQPDH
jgi:chromosome segregation ATPase